MLSGIVYFEEIVENVKDATGIENARPLYDRIKRFVFNAEQMIGAGGLVVLKKKNYVIGDGFYDGKLLVLPADFVSEWSYGDLSDGKVEGNVLRLFQDGPTELTLKYLGFLLDQNGNPFTTRNRLEAIVAYATWRLYSSKLFLKEGAANIYQMYKTDYEDAMMEARGNDAFPTEEEWESIGITMNGGTFEAMTNCGMKTICSGSNDPYLEDVAIAGAEPTCISSIEGVSFSEAVLIGILSFLQKIYMQGISNGATTTVGVLRLFTSPNVALTGVSNGSASATTGTLLQQMVTVQCDESFAYSGGAGTYSFRLELGTDIGTGGIHYDAYAVPDRFRIEWDGVEVANSKFVGSGLSHASQLLALGYLSSEINLGTPQNSAPLLFNKTKASPTHATVYVDAPLGGTAWRVSGICIQAKEYINGTAVVTGTLTSIGNVQGSLMTAVSNSTLSVTGTLKAPSSKMESRSLGKATVTATLSIKAIAYCYTGIYDYPDPIHDPGGSVTYINSAGDQVTRSGIWSGDRVNIMAVRIVSKVGVAPCDLPCTTFEYNPTFGEAVSYTITYVDCNGTTRTEGHYGGEGTIYITNFQFLISIQGG